jgi:hypothetical protein
VNGGAVQTASGIAGGVMFNAGHSRKQQASVPGARQTALTFGSKLRFLGGRYPVYGGQPQQLHASPHAGAASSARSPTRYRCLLLSTYEEHGPTVCKDCQFSLNRLWPPQGVGCNDGSIRRDSAGPSQLRPPCLGLHIRPLGICSGPADRRLSVFVIGRVSP